MQYQKEIDGLRAIAVVSVIFFHIGFELFCGGYVGVDIFFVISGYLITSIILHEKQNNIFSIVNFYERRARRILPALFFIILFSSIFSWTILSLNELKNFQESIISTLLFISNIFFSRDTNYFGNTSEIKPLLHTWSLAIEEQYYIIFPVLMMLMLKFGKKAMFVILISIAVISLSYANHKIQNKPKLFFLIEARCFELLIGSMIAFISDKNKEIIKNHKFSNLASLIGLLMILFAIFKYNNLTPFPSSFTLIPICGALLIILFTNSSSVVGKILGCRLFSFLGLISYSLYLWHQPILAFTRIKYHQLDNLKIVIILIVIFSLSLISWKYVEKTFRNKNKFSRKFIFVFSLCTTLFFISINVFFILTINPLLKIGVTELDLAKILATQKVIYSDNDIDERKFISYRIENEKSNPNILIFGSSRMMQISEKNFDKKSLNLSVSNAIIKDLIAIIGKSLDKFKPQKIFIGIDPWTLYYLYPNSWRSISKEYYNSLLKFNSQQYALSKITNVNDLSDIKINELSLTIYKIHKKINSKQVIDINDRPSKHKDKIRNDGSRVINTQYIAKYQLNNEKDIKNDYDFKRWLPDTAGINCNNSQTDKIDFENFLDYLKQKHQIILVLPPYHPTHYNEALKTQEKCRGSNSKLLQSEIEIRELAKRKDIRIIGSFNPEINDCKKDEFIDWIHPKESCMKKILSKNNFK